MRFPDIDRARSRAHDRELAEREAFWYRYGEPVPCPESVYECNDCGALVYCTDRHDAFHASIQGPSPE